MGRSKRVQRPGERSGGESSRERRASSSRLTFRHASEQTPDLSGAWQPGLRALREADRNRIDSGRYIPYQGKRRRGELPQNQVSRPATMGLRSRISADQPWCRSRLLDRGPPRQPWRVRHRSRETGKPSEMAREHAAEWIRAMDKAFVWISSGKTTLGDRRRRLLTLLGLRQVGRFFKIPSEFTI